ncbi:phage protease [Nitrospina gracilis]|uniref:phage protease n=1 Tax=Nitrospina gracilis TaxID=35801 RepID=UPI001F1E4DB0|nr:phage protease [Nitrospina gracilis]MCF8719219.1 phage I-like protein [Nitrospina gracilis Nb-211]
MLFDLLIVNVNEISKSSIQKIQIVPIGEFVDGNGKRFSITAESVQRIIEKFNRRTNDLVVDYEHQTLDGVQAPAAGWIKSLINEGERGLWAEVEWTERGRKYIEGREYRYLSPVLLSRKKDERGVFQPEELHSAALTNDPAIDGMVPVAAKTKHLFQKETIMELKAKILELLGLKKDAPDSEIVTTLETLQAKAKGSEFLKLLGLKDDAREPEIKQEIETLQAKAKNPGEQESVPKVLVTALGLKDDASVSEAEATILAMKHGADGESAKKIATLEGKLAGMEAETLVSGAMKEGKITADQKDWALDYAKRDQAGFKVFVSKATRVVPLDKTQDAPKEDLARVDETTELVAAQFGNSKDDLVKFGGVKIPA